MFAGRYGLKKIVFLFCFLAPWWHFRELLCMSGVRIPRARTTVWRKKKMQTSGNALHPTCQKETATFQQQRTRMRICYSPGLVFCSPPRDCSYSLAVCFPEAAATSLCTLCMWSTHDTPTCWSIWNIYLYSLCRTISFCWSSCCLSVGDKD